MYRTSYRWQDGTTAFMTSYTRTSCLLDRNASTQFRYTSCAHLALKRVYIKLCFFHCLKSMLNKDIFQSFYFICEEPHKTLQREFIRPLRAIKTTNATLSSLHLTVCQKGHLSKDFLSCEIESDCDSTHSRTVCITHDMEVPMFVCSESVVNKDQLSVSTVHYSHVCDFVQHCPNNLDESFCVYEPCTEEEVSCGNGQCVHKDKVSVFT